MDDAEAKPGHNGEKNGERNSDENSDENSDGNTDNNAESTEKAERTPMTRGEKFACALICAMFPGLLIFASLMEPVDLVPSGGAPPVSEEVKVSTEEDPHRFHTWDVTEGMASTFRRDGHVLGIGDARLRGRLTVSVPDGCIDRAVRWVITVDGERTAQGTLKWLRKYELATDYTLDHTPGTVTVSARWDGGDDECPSFHLVWDSPRIRKGPD
ncbi:hypothetical protein ACIRPT_36335 [Streptomyces sp. NPDC101227]|uniref:hypothetical protein n=1 Tax=Streptomyces sp. NPDC101227 TaxID=3366136 RepID=UPI00382524BF